MEKKLLQTVPLLGSRCRLLRILSTRDDEVKGNAMGEMHSLSRLEYDGSTRIDQDPNYGQKSKHLWDKAP